MLQALVGIVVPKAEFPSWKVNLLHSSIVSTYTEKKIRTLSTFKHWFSHFYWQNCSKDVYVYCKNAKFLSFSPYCAARCLIHRWPEGHCHRARSPRRCRSGTGWPLRPFCLCRWQSPPRWPPSASRSWWCSGRRSRSCWSQVGAEIMKVMWSIKGKLIGQWIDKARVWIPLRPEADSLKT